MSLRGIRDKGKRCKYLLVAMLMMVVYVTSSFNYTNPAHAAVGSITEYSIPTSGVNPSYLAIGPDNNIWYTGGSSIPELGKVTTTGSFTEYAGSASPNRTQAITKGSDGNLWYGVKLYDSGGWPQGGRIVKANTNGTVLGQYSLPSSHTADDMILGSDGNIWFTEIGFGYIGKITPTGSITEYQISLPNYGQHLMSITSGPDGNLWFTVAQGGNTTNQAIGKITPSGSYTLYPLATRNAQPAGITSGPDGNLWFTEQGSSKIGVITTSGSITEYSVTSGSNPYSIAAGPDGALWFTELTNRKIGRISTSGVITEYSLPTGSWPMQIISGPDGNMWFANNGTNKIGRVTTSLINQTVSFTSSAPNGAGINGSTYSPTASATSGLPVVITVDSSSASVCSIVSGVVSFHGEGTCMLNANQSGNADYNAAPQVQQSFAVSANGDTSVTLDCPSTASIGSTVTCNITLTNDGPAEAEGTTLTALVPNSLSGVTLSGGGTLVGHTITWTTPSLASGASITITVSGTASAASKTQFNAALLQTSPDMDNTNNIASSILVIS